MSIVIAAASNNIAKGFYALVFGDRRTGKSSLIALLGYSLIGLLPLLMLLPL